MVHWSGSCNSNHASRFILHVWSVACTLYILPWDKSILIFLYCHSTTDKYLQVLKNGKGPENEARPFLLNVKILYKSSKLKHGNVVM
jgi:hypothetical protein